MRLVCLKRLVKVLQLEPVQRLGCSMGLALALWLGALASPEAMALPVQPALRQER